VFPVQFGHFETMRLPVPRKNIACRRTSSTVFWARFGFDAVATFRLTRFLVRAFAAMVFSQFSLFSFQPSCGMLSPFTYEVYESADNDVNFDCRRTHSVARSKAAEP